MARIELRQANQACPHSIYITNFCPVVALHGIPDCKKLHHFEFERAGPPNREVRRPHDDSSRGNRGKEKEKKSKEEGVDITSVENVWQLVDVLPTPCI